MRGQIRFLILPKGQMGGGIEIGFLASEGSVDIWTPFKKHWTYYKMKLLRFVLLAGIFCELNAKRDSLHGPDIPSSQVGVPFLSGTYKGSLEIPSVSTKCPCQDEAFDLESVLAGTSVVLDVHLAVASVVANVILSCCILLCILRYACRRLGPSRADRRKNSSNAGRVATTSSSSGRGTGTVEASITRARSFHSTTSRIDPYLCASYVPNFSSFQGNYTNPSFAQSYQPSSTATSSYPSYNPRLSVAKSLADLRSLPTGSNVEPSSNGKKMESVTDGTPSAEKPASLHPELGIKIPPPLRSFAAYKQSHV